MPAVLSHHSYGKSRIRLTKVTRRADRHDVRELSIDIALQGDFEQSYTSGDNRLVIPTDTMKNVAFALAKRALARLDRETSVRRSPVTSSSIMPM